MKRVKLLYLILLVVLFLFLILYRGVLSLQLFLFALIFPAALWILLRILKYTLHASLRHSDLPVRTGDSFQWVLSIQNRSFLPASHADVTLEYGTSLSDDIQKVCIQLPVLPCNTQRVRFTFRAAACGTLTMRVGKLTVYDPLRLFRARILLNAEDTVCVLPAADPMLGAQWEFKLDTDSDSDTFDQKKAGDDPSELFDLHLYREGDAVSRIYWKLSSKLDQLLVKEYSLPLSGQMLLLPDYRDTDDTEQSALRLDAMLSAVQTAAQRLHEQDIPFAMLLCNKKDGLLPSETAESAEDAESFLLSLLREKPAPQSDEAAHLALIESLLTEPGHSDHVLLFLPQLSEAAAAMLCGLPDPSRLTVFAVRSENQDTLPDLPCETVLLSPTPPPSNLPQSIVNVLTETEMFYADEEGGDRL